MLTPRMADREESEFEKYKNQNMKIQEIWLNIQSELCEKSLIRNRSKEKALNKSIDITLLFFMNLNLIAQVLTNLWETDNMNNAIFS
jgi:hypothetical protein